MILDHKLPDIEGIKILQFLKRLFIKLPVIYMTAYSSEDLMLDFYDAGGRKYLRKPFKVSDLSAYVQELLTLRRDNREARVPPALGRGTTRPPEGNGSRDPRIARAQAYIAANLGGPLRLQDVARAVGVSKSHLARAFKRATRQTVERFILSRRMAIGIALLFDLTLSIKEVAALVGFSDATNFTRAFKSATHWTPSDLRKYLLAKLAPGSLPRR